MTILVLWLILAVPWVGLYCAIVVFPYHTHLLFTARRCNAYLKETMSATMKIFEIFYFLFKSFVKVELSYVFTLNLFTIA